MIFFAKKFKVGMDYLSLAYGGIFFGFIYRYIENKI